MKCPYCNHPDTRVIDSRPVEDDCSIRRRRSCDECGKRFTTYEKVETIPLIIIKKDNNREQYNRGKIERGIIRACYKRPVPAEEVQKAVERIETKVFSLDFCCDGVFIKRRLPYDRRDCYGGASESGRGRLCAFCFYLQGI